MGMGNFFKNVGTSIGKTVEKTADKIDEVVDVQKIKYKLSRKQDEIAALEAELGKNMLKHYAESSQADLEALRNTHAKIQKIKAEIDELNVLRAQKEGNRICPGCSAVISKEDEYCSRCGMKVNAECENESGEKETEDPSDGI